MLDIYISTPLIPLYTREWKQAVNKIIDIITQVSSTDISYDMLVSNSDNVTLLRVEGLDPEYYDIIRNRSISYDELRIIQTYSKDMEVIQYNSKERSHIFKDVKFEMLCEFTLTHTNVLVHRFEDKHHIDPTKSADFHAHLFMYDLDMEFYYINKKDVCDIILSDIMQGPINDSIENAISDYVVFYLMPLVLYNKETDDIFIYNVKCGWEICNKDLLYGYISQNIKELFVYTKLILYYGSVAARNRLINDVYIKIKHMCSVDQMDVKYLIGMKDGIYDSKTTVFHEFSPILFVNKSTNIPYTISFEKQHLLTNILLKIFPDEEVLTVVIRWFGYLLEFGNPEKFLTIWHGQTGNNGKSWIQRILKEALNDYYHNIPTSLITGKRAASNSATPELASIEHKLVVFFQEPDSVEKIHSGRVKELTGNDTMYIRQLYKSPRTIDIWAKMVIVSNNRMETVGLDLALRRRFLVIPFESTFVTLDEYQERIKRNNNMKYFFIRQEMDHLCKELAPEFMKLMVEQHRLYKKDKIKITKKIYDETVSFILSNNRTLKFIRAYIGHCTGEMSSLILIYEYFKGWHKQMYPAKSVPSMEMFTDELNKESIDIVEGSYLKDVMCTYL